ncbi:MAG TPA: hypothetical protein VIX73_23160 [Kofleriaceae bacterium]|jgi:hypothetical protein
MSDTDTILAKQLHQAALDVAAARQRGDKVAESQARARLESLSNAYRAAGKTEDDLEAAKEGGLIGQIFAGLARLTRNAAVLIVLGIAAFFLYQWWRRRRAA